MFRSFTKEFKEFAMEGNMLDLAIGVIIGAASTEVINSLVNDIIMPPIGYLLGGVDFSNLYVNLSDEEYLSLAEAQAAGAATINYGLFLSSLIYFLIVALVLFLIVKGINKMRHGEEQQKDEKSEK